MAVHRLTFGEKLGYSVGEFGGSGLWQIMMIFLPAFYTDTFGLAPATVGLLLFVSRILDAITDPIMGIIADRTVTRWGKFRPYLLWMAVPFALLAFAMFYAPELSEGGKVAYAYASYIAMMVVYTMMMIPFSALSGVMTSDNIDRTQLNSFRFMAAFAAALAVQGLFNPMVDFFGEGNDVVGSRYSMALFGLIAIGTFLIAFFSAEERVQSEKQEGQSVWRDVRDLTGNVPWAIVLAVSLISLIYISIRSAAQVYYVKYFTNNEELLSVFMVTGTIAILVGIALTGWLTRVLGKKQLFIISSFVCSISSFAMYFVQPGNILLLFTLQIIFSFGSGPAMPLLWSMMADAADYSEWRTGRRATGLVFSASTFAQKAGGALGGAIAMFVLAYYGYVANTQQNDATLDGMRQMMSVYPGFGSLLCIVVLYYYPLDQGDLEKIEAELNSRRLVDRSVA